MTYLLKLQLWFNDLPATRKISLLLAVMVISVMTLSLSWWVLSPSYAILFTNLEDQDASQIINQLEDTHINYQLRNNGSDILIDKNLIAKTRLKLMGSGMQLKNSVGFELFDKNDFGMTDFSQKINYQRALQGELERTISSLDEVSQARVHLVIPESHLFNNEENEPKAAVTLHLKQALKPKQVSSIQRLITASIAHLTTKNVIVVDQNGNTLSLEEEDNYSTQLTAKKSIERYLNDKVTQILQKIVTRDEVIVKIDAVINYDELQRELIKPQTQGLITHEKEVTHSTTDKTAKNKTNQDSTSEKSYQFGSEKELYKRAIGTIERLSISVALPQNTDEQTREQIKRLVKNTVGFNDKRGDMISVEALISTTPLDVSGEISQSHQTTYQPVTYLTLYFLMALMAASIIGTLILKKIRLKKRQLLLIELTEWLTHHE